jgi:2'-5' RNA ligase
MRCFIAVNVDNPLVSSFIGELSEVDAALRPVKPENLHLTLKFLGEVPDESIDGIKRAMDDSFSNFESFEASLEGTGAFPSMNYMRVVWVGMKENSEKLVEMQKALDENLAPLGFAREKRFHPHLTIARVKSQRGKEKVKAFINKNKERPFGKLAVDSVALKKSVLSPKGPTYSTIGKTKLEGG